MIVQLLEFDGRRIYRLWYEYMWWNPLDHPLHENLPPVDTIDEVVEIIEANEWECDPFDTLIDSEKGDFTFLSGANFFGHGRDAVHVLGVGDANRLYIYQTEKDGSIGLDGDWTSRKGNHLGFRSFHDAIEFIEKVLLDE